MDSPPKRLRVEAMPNLFASAESVEALIFQAVGCASMCWENPDGAGEFDVKMATEIGNQVLERLSELNA